MKNLIFTLFTIVLLLSVTNAQITIDIADGMTVETTGSVYISGASDVIENNTGYLNGTVESSALSAATQFAGLSLSSGFSGTITRTTGTEYTGNGAGTNTLRNYELNNSGSAITPNLTSALASNETNGMTGPFFLYTYGTDWTGNGDGSTGSTVSANAVSIGTGITDLVISEGTGVNAKLLMEGPYAGTSSMSTTLNPTNIPATSPYSEDPRTASAIPATAVDWVLVQLYEEPTPGTFNLVESRSAFLKSDGTLMEDDGSVGIGVKSAPGDYYIVVKHRNHLGVMSSAAQVGLTWGN